jgi:ABC-type sulfate transport system permease component
MFDKHRFFLDRAVPVVLWVFGALFSGLLLFMGLDFLYALLTNDIQKLNDIMAVHRNDADAAVAASVYISASFLSVACLFLGGLGAYFLFDSLMRKK